MEKSFLQVRIDKKDKELASDILENLGTNLSSAEVRASMAMENMPLTDDEVQLLHKYQVSADGEKDNMRNKLIAEYTEE